MWQRGADLPPLGWQSEDPFDPARFAPIRQSHLPVKPSGGLWTAPVVRSDATAWTMYWSDEDEDDAPTSPIYQVIPDPDAAVFAIDDVDDLLELERAFPAPETPHFSAWASVDWEAASEKIDAVWLTERGQWRTRFSSPGLNGWDCETVLWLRPAFHIWTEGQQ